MKLISKTSEVARLESRNFFKWVGQSAEVLMRATHARGDISLVGASWNVPLREGKWSACPWAPVTLGPSHPPSCPSPSGSVSGHPL